MTLTRLLAALLVVFFVLFLLYVGRAFGAVPKLPPGAKVVCAEVRLLILGGQVVSVTPIRKVPCPGAKKKDPRAA